MTKAATTLSISSEFSAGFMALLAPVDAAALSKDFSASSPAPTAKKSGQALPFNVET